VSRSEEQPSALIVMAPVRRAAEDAVLAVLAATPTGPDSPFARVCTTHFARLMLIGALTDADGEPVSPAQAYLLLTAEIDGSLEQWAAAVATEMGAEIDRVFEHCERYPGSCDPSGFLDFINEHRIEAGFSIVAYRASVAAVRDSLELQRALREFAVASQGLGASALASAWRERFGG
jgi:hypothetical protein